ncbi:FHA domain-containing protein [Curtobacterium flaccumfaciens]|nr:FHA domain-containing protein [Curtobacterium flaccumfaciens]
MSSIVVETVIPVMTCGRCGAASTQGQRFCTDCGALLGRTVAADEYDALRDVVPAGAGTVALARLLDVVVCLLGAAAGAALLFLAHTAVPSSDPVGTAVAGAVLGVVVTAAIVAIRASSTGRGPGGLLLRTRVVDVDDALPAGPARQVARLRGGPHRRAAGAGPWSATTGTVTASLRTGRDPLSPALPRSAPPSVPPRRRASARLGTRGRAHVADADGTDWRRGAGRTRRHTTCRGRVRAGGRVLRGATAERARRRRVRAGRRRRPAVRLRCTALVPGTCVIGRNPEAEPGIETVAVPDLSRTLSKTHVALVQAHGTVVLRDLGSTNGTSVTRTDASFEDLVPGVDLAVSTGTTVRIGDHAFVVDRIGATT